MPDGIPSAGKGDRAVGGGGGMRIVYSASLKRSLSEAGLSSVTGNGRYPSGAEVYQAARRQKPDNSGRYVIRIYGAVNRQLDSWRYAEDGSFKWLSRTVTKQQVLQLLHPVRFGDGGNGLSDGPFLPYDNDPRYNNSFLRIVSEISGHGWDRIETVQFFD